MSRQVFPHLSVRVAGLERAEGKFVVFVDVVALTDEVLWYREGRWQTQNKRTNAIQTTTRRCATTGDHVHSVHSVHCVHSCK